MKSEQLEGATLDILSPQEVQERLDRNEIVLIDVRTPQEYTFEHIRGALLYPMSGFDPAKLPTQTDKPLVFHCGSGVRSTMVAKRCAAAGITQLAHMEGGMGAWKAAKLPIIAVDPQSGNMVAKP